MKIEVIIS